MARSLADAQTELDLAYAARTRILTTGAQSVAVDGNAVTYASLSSLNDTIRKLEAEVDRLTAATSSGPPYDFRLPRFS
jgi:hypothetical protein